MGRHIEPNCAYRVEAAARAIRVAERKKAKDAAILAKAAAKQARQDARRAVIKAKAERMFSMYRQGVTLGMIGKQHGITRERARQYIASLGYAAKDGGQCKQAEERRATK